MSLFENNISILESHLYRQRISICDILHNKSICDLIPMKASGGGKEQKIVESGGEEKPKYPGDAVFSRTVVFQGTF